MHLCVLIYCVQKSISYESRKFIFNLFHERKVEKLNNYGFTRASYLSNRNSSAVSFDVRVDLHHCSALKPHRVRLAIYFGHCCLSSRQRPFNVLLLAKVEMDKYLREVLKLPLIMRKWRNLYHKLFYGRINSFIVQSP